MVPAGSWHLDSRRLSHYLRDGTERRQRIGLSIQCRLYGWIRHGHLRAADPLYEPSISASISQAGPSLHYNDDHCFPGLRWVRRFQHRLGDRAAHRGILILPGFPLPMFALQK